MVAKILIASLYTILIQCSHTQSIGCSQVLAPYSLTVQIPVVPSSLSIPALTPGLSSPTLTPGLSIPTLAPGLNLAPGMADLGLRGPNLAGLYSPGSGYGVSSIGGSFLVNSISPIAPTGLTILSENFIEGSLIVRGELPFLTTIAIDGAVPTTGFGAISYGCGNGDVAITSDTLANVLGTAYGQNLATPSYGPGLATPSYGLSQTASTYCPTLASPTYDSGLVTSSYDPVAAASGPLYSTYVAQGLGYNGIIGCGC